MRRVEVPVDAAALVDFALRLVSIPSPSGAEGEVADCVAGEMARLGFEVERDPAGNVTGTLDAGPGPCLLIDSHMDTVGVTEPGDWRHHPYGQIVGGRLYGRGAMDMKGPLAASIHGVAAIRDRLRRGRVVVSASVAEELVEGPAASMVATRVGADRVVIGEATSLGLAIGQRGRAELVIEVAGRSTHSSRPELGVNAAEVMADVVVALRELEAPSHPVLGPGLLVLTDLLSRPYPGLSVVPDRCVATYDRRTLPGETETTVIEPVRRAAEVVAARAGAEVTVRIAEDDFATYTGERIVAPNFAPAWCLTPDAEIVTGAAGALRAVGIEPRLTHYAFCTNGSGTAGRLGIPTVGFGPGAEELAHRVDEHIELGELVRGAVGYGALALHLTGGDE
ncbi:MAG TPA: YgeY family selenium metabolism-linked hydrolase [Candidatus Dormibacteraeota bacterium]|nr:YgeY family selenium metabolism-linked hydrolase [Candidatus Dormibacteraeota bacterium]